MTRRRSYCKVEKKVRYRDDLDAKMALSTIARHSTRDRVPSRVYKCPHCRGYHLTSQAKRSEVVDAK